MTVRTLLVMVAVVLCAAGCKKKEPAAPAPAADKAEKSEKKEGPVTPDPDTRGAKPETPALADVTAQAAPDAGAAIPDTGPADVPPPPTSGPELWELACQHAFALAKKDEGLADVYLQRHRLAKECEAEFASIHMELADKAATCALGITDFQQLTACFDVSKHSKTAKKIDGSGEGLWREACEHTIELVRLSGALDGADASIITAVKKECLSQFAQTDEKMADKAAKCMLAQKDMETMDGCVLQLRSADKKEVEARPPLDEDPWGDVALLHAQLFEVFMEGLTEPATLGAALEGWYTANTDTLELKCVRMRQLPAEDPDTNYSGRIQFYTDFVSIQIPATLEAALPSVLAAYEGLEQRQQIATLLGKFTEICNKAQARGLGQPEAAPPAVP